jgi:hypothetical protein
MSMYSRRQSDNNSDVESGSNLGHHANHAGNSSTYITEKNNNNQNAQKSKKNMSKVDKSKFKKQVKKFPELKMAANGEYRNSNHTMLTDDDQNLNVSYFKSSSFIY